MLLLSVMLVAVLMYRPLSLFLAMGKEELRLRSFLENIPYNKQFDLMLQTYSTKIFVRLTENV